MYCENCGHKLNTQDLFCEDCGSKVNKTVVVPQKKKTDKTLWIILGCVFGGIALLGILFVIFLISIFNYTTVSEDNFYGDRINDYIEEYENISSIESV